MRSSRPSLSRSTQAAEVDHCSPGVVEPPVPELVGDVGEGAVAVVVVEPVAAEGGYIQVFEAVVVEVTDGDAHAVADALQAGFFGDVLEGAVFFLVVEAVPVGGAGFLRGRSLSGRDRRRGRR